MATTVIPKLLAHANVDKRLCPVGYSRRIPANQTLWVSRFHQLWRWSVVSEITFLKAL